MQTRTENTLVAGRAAVAGRRSLLLGVAGSAAVGVAAMSAKAFAQGPPTRNIEVLRVISGTVDAARNQMIAVVTPLLGKAPLESEKGLQDVELGLLGKLGLSLGEIPETARISYVSAEQIDFAITMQGHKVQFIQPRSTVTKEIKRDPQTRPGRRESLLHIVLDIFWDTLGIGGSVRRALTKAFSGSSWVRLFDDLAEAVARRDAALIALQAERLLAAIFGRAGLAVIARVVSEEELKSILVGVAARFVPFIGWAFWIASFLFALHRNWAKLEPYLTRP